MVNLASGTNEERTGQARKGAHEKTSPNLSPTAIVWASSVMSSVLARFARDLAECRGEEWREKEISRLIPFVSPKLRHLSVSLSPRRQQL